MEKKYNWFTYKGQSVIIQPGTVLPKTELVMRLKEMGFSTVDTTYNKNDIVNIYEIAMNYDNNKIKIFNSLIKDTQYFNSLNSFQKKEFYNKHNSINESDTKRYNFSGQQYDTYRSNIPENNSNQPLESSSILRTIVRLILDHKMAIAEILFYLFLIYSYDAFVQSFAQHHAILGRFLLGFRNIFTPRRLALGLLLFYVIKYIFNVFFYYFFGFGMITIMILIFKNRIKDFIFGL